jgi:hypothetical protein
VRGHAAWALGRIGSGDAIEALQRRLNMEQDPEARNEIADALVVLSKKGKAITVSARP